MGEPSGRTHRITYLTIDNEPWIADVGFGANGLRAPIRLETDRINEQDGLRFRLVDRPPFGYMLQVDLKDRWQDLYSFDLGHVVDADISLGNHYTSTSPQSFFTWMKVATLPCWEGRTSLGDHQLTIERNGETERVTLPTGQAYIDALKEHFGIELGIPYDTLRPLNPPPG